MTKSIAVLSRRRRRYSVGPTGPTNSVAPVVSGTTTVGQTLSCTTGTWSGEGTITYAYQWKDDGVAISGATSSTYTLQAAEEGGFITCTVTATDDNGSAAATSNSVGPVAAATGAPLSLDFTSGTYTDGTNTALADITTFTRTSTATYVDSSGVMQTATSGTVRDAHHEYDGTSWNRTLLLETDAATNFVTESEDFTTWFIADATLVGGDTLTATTNNARIWTDVSFGSGTDHVFWADLEAGTGDVACIRCNSYDSNVTVYFDLSTGAVGSETNGTGLIFEVAPGVYRCAVYFSSVDLVGNCFINVCDASGSLNVTTGKTLVLHRAQGEDGWFPSSYIPTSGSTVTRAAETLQVDAASVPWSTTAMTFLFKGAASWTDNGSTDEVILFGSYVDASNTIDLSVSGAGADTGKLLATAENGGTVETADGPSNTAAGYRKTVSAGLRYTTSDLQVVDGGTAGTNQTGVGGSIYDYATNSKTLTVGGDGNAYAFNGTIDLIEMWDSDEGAAFLEVETA